MLTNPISNQGILRSFHPDFRHSMLVRYGEINLIRIEIISNSAFAIHSDAAGSGFENLALKHKPLRRAKAGCRGEVGVEQGCPGNLALDLAVHARVS